MITNLNFDDEYDNIIKLIDASSFVSFDCEMSGINDSREEFRHRKDDNADERYFKMRQVANKYSLIQVGLCMFIKDQDNKLKAHPYVFYLFPQNSQEDIVLSVSSIDFLKKNNMNFDTWITNGIPFVTSNGEEYWTDKLGLREKQKEEIDGNMIILTEQKDKDFVERNLSNLKKVLEDPSQTQFTFEFCNAYIRRYLYQYMEANHPDITVQKTSDNKLQVLKLSSEEIETMKRKQLHKALGFRSIFKCLKNKILVGHNCMYDLLFMMRYLENPLAEDFTSFKVSFNNMFPYVFDTKYISSTGLLGTVYSDTVLGDLYTQILNKNKDTGKNLIVELGDKFNNYNDKNAQLHDAGYDAFITGSIFLGLLNDNNDDSYNIENLMEIAKEKCGNIIFSMFSLYYFDFNQSRPNGLCTKSSNTYYLGGFTSKVLTNDLHALFTPSTCTISELIWINDKSTFVTLKKAISDELIDITIVKESIELPEGWSLLSLEQFEESKKEKSKVIVNDNIDESPLKKQKV